LFHQPETIIPLTKDTEFTSEYLKYFLSQPSTTRAAQHGLCLH